MDHYQMIGADTFTISEEQTELQNSLRKLLSDRYTPEIRRSKIVGNERHDKALLQALIDLGLFEYFATPGSRDSSGKVGEGAGIREVALMARECGRALPPLAITETLLALQILALAGFDKVKPELWGKIVGGENGVGVVASGFTYPQPIEFEKSSESVTGTLSVTSVTSWIDWLIYADSTSDSVLLIDIADADKAKRQQQVALDITKPLFDIVLDRAPYVVIPKISGRELHHYEQVVVASEICGAAAQAFEMTLEYTKTRKQFEQPIASFQAVQHKLADSYLQLEAMQATANFAAWSADHSTEQLAIAAQSAIAYACSEGPKLIETAIQLHGGIGFTWEYDLHLYLRRVRALAALYNSTERDVSEILAAV